MATHFPSVQGDPGLGIIPAAGGAQADRELGRALGDKQRSLNERYTDPLPAAIAETAEKTRVFIFNVGPWQHIQWMGSLGRKIIKGCPEGAEYSEPLVIDGLVIETYPDTEKTNRYIFHDGKEVANQIIGVGKHLLPSNSLVKCGVFVSPTNPPSPDDVAKARREFLLQGEREIAEANSAHEHGPKAFEETIQRRHYEYAKILQKTVAECPWLGRSIENTKHANRIACPFCGETMGAELPKCPNCKEVVNQAAYKAAQARARGQATE